MTTRTNNQRSRGNPHEPAYRHCPARLHFLVAAAPTRAVKKELKNDGTWLASQTSVENDNRKVVKFANFRLIIRDEDRFTLLQKFSDEKAYGELASGTFTVDPSKEAA